MVRYWIKSWILVEDDTHDEIPSVETLQDEANREIDANVLACQVLAVAAIKPPEVG